MADRFGWVPLAQLSAVSAVSAYQDETLQTAVVQYRALHRWAWRVNRHTAVLQRRPHPCTRQHWREQTPQQRVSYTNICHSKPQNCCVDLMLKGGLYSFRIYVSCEQSGMEVSLTGLISLYLISPYFTFIKHAVLQFIFLSCQQWKDGKNRTYGPERPII